MLNLLCNQSFVLALFATAELTTGGRLSMTISKELVEAIIGKMMFDEDEVKAGDRAMIIYILKYKYLTDGIKEVLNYHVDIKNQKRFEYVRSLLSVGRSFSQIFCCH